MNQVTPILHEVFSVSATGEPDVFILDVDITDASGQRYRCDYVSRPDDPFGLAPTIRQWLVDNPEFPITPYVEPPPQPYSLPVSTLWGRMTDLEAEDFDVAMSTASPLRLRRQFNSASTMASDGELFAFVKGVLNTVVSPQRADELMADGNFIENLTPVVA